MRLLGHRDDVPDLLAAADVVVSSAVWEGQPVGLQEALHAGAAVVATDVGGTAAVVGDAALLVPPADAGLAGARDPRRRRCTAPVRDNLRSRAVERAASCRPRPTPWRRPLTAYRSVLPGRRPRPEHRSEGWEPASRRRVGSGRTCPHDVSLKPVAHQTTKHIFVTGGVASSLGKGLTASSLGHLLRARGLRVTMQKLDPYLNVDPGTMNPFQHGEVFVTDDGAETDLDIGHYERFLDVNLKGSANVTTGQVYNRVIARERRGEYLGDTVQVIPHITNEIKARMRARPPAPGRHKPTRPTSSSPRSAAPSATSSRCRSSRRPARSATTWAATTSSSCTSRWCPTSPRAAS